MSTAILAPSDQAGSLEAAPSEDLLWPLSAATADGLPEVARRLALHLEREPSLLPRDVAFTYQTGKAHHAHRVAFASASRDDVAEECRVIASRMDLDDGGRGARLLGRDRPRRVAFLFTGQGSQYAGMGAELYPTSRVFRESIDRCAGVLDKLLPCPLVDVLFDRSAPARIHETELTQPALFALEYAIARQWMAWGFVPGMMLGHSLGEWVAACIGGAFSVEDACSLIFHRGSLMQRLCRRGAMLSVAATEERITPLINRHGQGAAIAVHNTSENVVVAGDVEVIAELREALSRHAIGNKQLSVSHAFHSPLMEPMLASFARKLDEVRATALSIPLISNLDGSVRDGVLDTAYWTEQVRSPVRFTSCLAALHGWAPDIILEIGPHPVLGKLAQQNNASGALVLQSLRRDRSAVQALYASLGRAWSEGVDVPWADLHEGHSPRRVHVPTYPYRRTSCLLGAAPDASEGTPQRATKAVAREIDSSSDLATVERVLSAVWCDVLGIKSVSADSDFSELGADSLDAVGLLGRTKQVTGLSLTLEEQYKERTLGRIARLLHERLAHQQVAAGASETIAQETVSSREDSVRREPAPSAVSVGAAARELAHVLVVGATGYLGAHVVKELCDTTSARIDCLISPGGSDEEVRDTLRLYFGDELVLGSSARIRQIRGALDAEGFGMTAAERSDLGASLDTILDLTSADGASDGAAGVASALAFLESHPNVRFHHVSTLRALGAATAVDGELGEPISPDELATSPSEADRLAAAAQRSGARVTVHRVGDLVGRSPRGLTKGEMAKSAFYREVRGAIMAKVVPEVDAVFDVTPVDYAASALVELARLDSASGRTFHLCNPVPLEQGLLHDAVRALGYSITALPLGLYTSWRGEEIAAGRDVLASYFTSLRFTCEATQIDLERAGVHCPAPDRELVERILGNGIEAGFFTRSPSWGLLRLALFGELE